jgi:hypothetical protein
MKTIPTTALALILSTSFALAQANQVQSSANTGWTSGSASEKPGMNSGISTNENSGMSNSERTEPGDFAVTDGLSGRGRAWNPTGQVTPGTSNAPAGNSGGE